MNIVITGGAGFIGSNLCERLLNEGHNVICLDNLYSGRLENIKELLGNKNFKFIKFDICNDVLDILLRKKVNDVDQIYNLACPASPPFYQKDPLKTLDTNYLGMKNMLNVANFFGAKILQASTSEVYGDPKVHPQPETYWGNVNPDGIRSCYDEGKRVAETMCFDYNRKLGTRVKVIRIFNTYGPKMRPDDGRVISNFIMQALKGTEITIYGDGSQTRSFCYVDDLVEAMIRVMNTSDDFVGPINLGNPGEFNMLELATKVLKYTKSNSNIVYKALPQDDPTQRKPVIDLAKKVLDWEPVIKLDEGLQKTIEYFKEY